jgi:hypothetical protein
VPYLPGAAGRCYNAAAAHNTTRHAGAEAELQQQLKKKRGYYQYCFHLFNQNNYPNDPAFLRPLFRLRFV